MHLYMTQGAVFVAEVTPLFVIESEMDIRFRSRHEVGVSWNKESRVFDMGRQKRWT